MLVSAESELWDLQHTQSSSTPEICWSRSPVNSEKGRVNFSYLHNLYMISIKTCRQIIFVRIIIAVSTDISIYFTNCKCMFLLVLVFKCLKPKTSIICLKILNMCYNMTSAQHHSKLESGLIKLASVVESFTSLETWKWHQF